MKNIWLVVLFFFVIKQASLSQVNQQQQGATGQYSFEERIKLLEDKTDQMDLRLAKFNKQHHKGCKILVAGVLCSAMGTVMLLNEDIGGMEAATFFGALGGALSITGTVVILDSPRRLRTRPKDWRVANWFYPASFFNGYDVTGIYRKQFNQSVSNEMNLCVCKSLYDEYAPF